MRALIAVLALIPTAWGSSCRSGYRLPDKTASQWPVRGVLARPTHETAVAPRPARDMLTTRRYLPILSRMGRRRAGTLLPIEVDILTAALAARRDDQARFHGFELARILAGGDKAAKRLTSHGTLYKALGRLEDWGMLDSDWEDAHIAEAEGRPRRRLYQLTGVGEKALAAYRLDHPAPAARTRTRTSRPATARPSVGGAP